MSEIRATTISDASGTGPIDLHKQSAAKAHGYSDAVGTALFSSLNVSSLTDAAVGKREFNLTSAMSIVSSPCFGQNAGGNTHAPYTNLPDVSTLRLWQYNTAGAFTDYAGGASIFGDLA